VYGAPPFTLWICLLIAASVTLYYGAVVSGLYKDPMMARFREYGEERLIYPVCRLLGAVGASALLLALLISILWSPQSYMRRMFPPMVFFVLMVVAWGTSLFIYRRPFLREALPRWYFFLLRNATRQERRQLGYAWLRLPRKMRWRLNSDQKAFGVWVELLRLTVIYGAYDPKSAWDTWDS
jgi:hypothetical protein